MLTRKTGERSVRMPGNIEKSAAYIQTQFEEYGLKVQRQPYTYDGNSVRNVIARLQVTHRPSVHYVLGAHYHLRSDTMETLDFGFMAELVISLVTYLTS